MTWTALLVLAAGTYLFRLSGLVLADRLTLSANVKRTFDIAATTLLLALAVTAALTDGHGFADGARPAGVLAGVLAAWFRLPFFVVVVIAAATTALLRASGME